MATVLNPRKSTPADLDPFMEALRISRLPEHFPVPDPLGTEFGHRLIVEEIARSQIPPPKQVEEAKPEKIEEPVDYVEQMEKLRAEDDVEQMAKEIGGSTFPIHALPKALREWVCGLSLQTSTAPETAALLGLAASAAAMRNGTCVSPIGGWEEPLNLFVGLITTPGDQSAEVLHYAATPLFELECSELDARPPAGEAPKYGPDNPRRLIDELTARSLNFQLAQQSRISCLSTQGEIFRQLAGRRSISRDRLIGLLERCHDARDFVATLPRGRDEVVERPGVSIASLIDRATVTAIGKQRECPARSLLSCFLYAEPENEPTTMRVARPMPDEIGAAYGAGILRLAQWPNLEMRPGVEALQLFLNWAGEIDREIFSGSLAPIAEWAKRLAGTTLRIAGLLHAWESEEQHISPETMAAAIEIARWLVPQAGAALEQLGAADDDCDDWERAVLRLARVSGDFSGRSAWQRLRKTFERPANLRHTLADLVSRGYLTEIKAGKRWGLISQVERLEAFVNGPNECAESTPAEVEAAPPGGLEPAISHP